jgi:hypothetical protein
MTTEEPIAKYDFNTGKIISKIKKKGYIFGKRKDVGELKSEMIDGKKVYCLHYLIGRSPFSKDKSKFKQIEYWEEGSDWDTSWIEIKKSKNKLVFNTKVDNNKDGIFSPVNIKLGKDKINFFKVNESNILKDLQLKLNDILKVTIEKI